MLCQRALLILQLLEYALKLIYVGKAIQNNPNWLIYDKEILCEDRIFMSQFSFQNSLPVTDKNQPWNQAIILSNQPIWSVIILWNALF